MKPKFVKIENSDVMSLEGKASVINNGEWKNQLYKEVSDTTAVEVLVRLLSYYTWGNRGHSKMTVWLAVNR